MLMDRPQLAGIPRVHNGVSLDHWRPAWCCTFGHQALWYPWDRTSLFIREMLGGASVQKSGAPRWLQRPQRAVMSQQLETLIGCSKLLDRSTDVSRCSGRGKNGNSSTQTFRDS